MTTMLSTKDFILCDRAAVSSKFDTKIDHQKLYRSKNNKVYLGIGGVVGFNFTSHTTEAIIANFNLALKDGFRNCFDDKDKSPRLEKLFDKNYKDAIAYLTKHTIGGGILIYHTADQRYYFDSDCNEKSGPKVIPDKGFIQYGSGGTLALTLYSLGYNPIEIAAAIPNLDPMSSDKFDIYYTKDLNL